MIDKTLAQLYAEHEGKVSDKWSLYLTEYDRIFSGYRNKPVKILEIGIQNGGSLEIWSKYFLKGEKFIGCDINPDCSILEYNDPRIGLVVGDANSDNTYDAVLQHSSNFDIVIDDGSHLSSDIIKSFTKYFPHITNGGLFVAEDLHCSYWQEYGGGLFNPFSSITFFKSLADIINHEHWGIEKKRVDLFNGFSKKYGLHLDETVFKQIHSIEFTNSTCIIRKSPIQENLLGKRIIAGHIEKIFSGLQERPYETPSQAQNFWSTRELSPYEELPLRLQELDERIEQITNLTEILTKHDEHIRHLSQTVAKRDGTITNLNKSLAEHKEKLVSLTQSAANTKEQLASLNQLATNRNKQLDQLYSSTSWRTTAPLRIASHQLKRARHIPVLFKAAIKRGGGFKYTLKKALRLYREKGLAGIKHGVRSLPTSKHNSNTTNPSALGRLDYTEWVRRFDTLTDEKRSLIRDTAESLSKKPLVSVVIPTHNPRIEWLIEAIESVRNQVYPNWELCIVDNASSDNTTHAMLERYAKEDSRIKVIFRKHNSYVFSSPNSALELITGEWVALLDHDGLLPEQALLWIADAINRNPNAVMFYSDEDKIDENSTRQFPLFKPDWSPHLAISQAYLGHLLCISTKKLNNISRFTTNVEGAEQYDLWLRIAALGEQIFHIPRILYHSRIHNLSSEKTSEANTDAHVAGKQAVDNHFKQRYPNVKFKVEEDDHLHSYKVNIQPPDNLLVSIIIPTRDRVDLLMPCIEGIIGHSTCTNIEILILDNGSTDPETRAYLDSINSIDQRIRVIPADIPFNWSKLNNIGAKAAKGQVLIFLNNDTDIISPDWIERLAGYALLPDVGIVGALLLFEDGTIQHNGVVVGMGEWADHVYRTEPAKHSVLGPFISPLITRNVLAVTGACMAISREKLDFLGGFDEEFVICGSDVELCLRAWKNGYYNVICTEARLYHYESKTRSPHVPENDFRQSDIKYAPFREERTDPFFNPNLALDSTRPLLAENPRNA